MPYVLYSYKLKKCVPLLTEAEFAQIEPLLQGRVEAIKAYREKHETSLKEAKEFADSGLLPETTDAMDRYEELTGQRLERSEQLFEVRLSRYGSPCPSCAKPFRTPKASICAECGYELSKGRVAGVHPGAGLDVNSRHSE